MKIRWCRKDVYKRQCTLCAMRETPLSKEKMEEVQKSIQEKKQAEVEKVIEEMK